jgi:putative membrane protein
MMGQGQSVSPYCGMPPLPAELWQRWNLDPILIALLVIALGAYLVAARLADQAHSSDAMLKRACFVSGWLVGAAALISPLCALSVSLFSARVGQHMVLALVAAPLVLLGHSGPVYARLSPSIADWLARRRLTRVITSAPAAAVLFAILLWIWHAPGPYDATFRSSSVYWLMHLSLFIGALMVWNVVLDRSPRGAIPALAVGAFTTIQMTFLGALITIAHDALYLPHAATTAAWGVTPLTDQQLGGLIMWVPACTVFVGVSVLRLARILGDSRDPHPSPSPGPSTAYPL